MDCDMLNNLNKSKTAFESGELSDGEEEMNSNSKDDGDNEANCYVRRANRRLVNSESEDSDTGGEIQSKSSERLEKVNEAEGIRNHTENQIQSSRRLVVDSDEDDENTGSEKQIKPRQRLVIDSDEDEDENAGSEKLIKSSERSVIHSEEDCSIDTHTEKQIQFRQRLVIDSDEDENTGSEKLVKSSERSAIRSDEDDGIGTHTEKQIKSRQRIVIDSDDEEQDIKERTNTNCRLVIDSNDELGDIELRNGSQFSHDLNQVKDNYENILEGSENGDYKSPPKSSLKSRRIVKVFSDSDSDEDSLKNSPKHAQKSFQNSAIESATVKVSNKFSVLKKSKSKSEVIPTVNSNAFDKLCADGDLYDAEGSSSDDENGSSSDVEKENFDIGLEDIKKNARDSLKEKSRRTTSRLKKNEINNLHSESQRMLREGRVNLPYHIPQKKSLDEFLNRRKLTPSALKPKVVEIKKTLEEIEKVRQEEDLLKKLPDTKSKLNANIICDKGAVNEDEINSEVVEPEERILTECRKILEELCSDICKNETSSEVEVPPCSKDSEYSTLNLPPTKYLLLKNRMINCAPLPKLNGSSNSIICFDDDEIPNEVDEFIKRCAEHCSATTKTNSPLQQIELNILKSDKDKEGEVVLSSEKIQVKLKERDVKTPVNKPGANMMFWKRKLEVEMAKRRSQTRQNLINTEQLDNEEGFEGDASKDEEDFQKLTEDNSESETEEETESEDERVIIDKPKINNKFISDEAEESEEDDFSNDEQLEEEETGNQTTEEHSDEEIEEPNSKLVQQESFKLKLELSQVSDSNLNIKDTNCDNDGNNDLPLKDYSSQVSSSQAQKILSSQYVFGNFSNSSPEIESHLPSLATGQESVSTQDNLEELAGLCSGKWTSPINENQKCIASNDNNFSQLDFKNDVNEPQNSFNRDTQKILSDDELSISSLISDTIKSKKVKRIKSDSEDEDNESDDDLSDVGSNNEESNTPKKRFNKFFDDEAELSGSDVPSDEEDDVAEEDDVMLEELGDLEQFSEDELKSQVEKVHAKLMLDDDQRQLRHFKEMYLEDGELHLEGQQRIRKFKWRNSGESDNLETNNDGDSDSNDKEDDNDHEIRKFRFERDSWLNEDQNKSSINLSFDKDEDEFAFPCFKKNVQLFNRSTSNCQKPKTRDENVASATKPLLKSKILSGSFLSKSDKLSRIANIAKVTQDGPFGPNNSRNFVFAAISPSDEKPQIKRAATFPAHNTKLAKRLCLEKPASINSQDSIFNLL